MDFSFFTQTFKLALVNLTLHKMRSFLTTLGIVIGVLAVITMMAIGEGGKRETLKAVEQLGATNIIIKSVRPAEAGRNVSRRDSTLVYGLKRYDFDLIRDAAQTGMIPGIELIVPVRESGLDIVYGEKRGDAKTAAVATTPDFLKAANLRLERGRFLAGGDMELDKGTPVCVLGAGLSAQLFGTEDPIDTENPRYIRLQSTNGSKEFAVVGVLQPVGMNGGKGSLMIGRDMNFDLYFPLAMNESGSVIGDGAFGDMVVKRSQGSRETTRIELSQIYVKMKSADVLKPAANTLQRMMDVRHADQPDVLLNIPLELLKQLEDEQAVWDFVLLIIAGLALFVGGIGIMNITLATVTERTREIGIRRALGARKGHIVIQFLIETTTLSVLGGGVGVVAGIYAPPLITWLAAYFTQKSFPTYVSVGSVVVSFTISAVVGILAGLYPAVVAANKDPIEALRHD